MKTLNKKFFIKNKKAFTLVELIIVITILAILGTIAFISFQGYTKDTRDSVRLTDVKSIYDGLSIYKVQTSTTLLPDDYIEIQSGTTTISYQGYAGDIVQRGINLKNGGTDPLSKNYYIYTTDVSAKKIQLMTYLETADKDVELLSYNNKLDNLTNNIKQKLIENNLINQAYSSNTDTGYYLDKKIYVYGDKIGILTDENNVPLQETITSTGINLVTNTGTITTYFGGDVYDGGKSTNTGTTLINEINGAINNTLPCSPTTNEGYEITSLQDSQSGSFTKPLTISNGSGTGTIIATCNNGELTYSEPINNINCITNYIPNGTNDGCIADVCNGNLPENAELNGTQSIGNTWSYSTTSGVCNYQCQSLYHTEDSGVSCISDTKSVSCIQSGKPNNSIYNVGNVDVTWNGISWSTASNCGWSCDTGYHTEDNTTCISNTNTLTCGGSIPQYATASTSSTYNQTWNGSSWSSTYNWGENQAICDFNCNSGYVWNGNSCNLDTLDIVNSLRFDNSRNTYLSRTPSTIGNRQKWTWSGWIKRAGLSNGGTNGIFVINSPASNSTGIQFYKDMIDIFFVGGYSYRLTTSTTFTNTEDWMHLIVSVDTTPTGGTNNVKIYVNNTLLTTLGTSSYPPTGYLTDVNNSTLHVIGKDANGSNLNGYLSEVNFIDGQSLSPSDFGVISSGKRLPKAYAGVYGTNGFHLDFSDNTSLGKDISGLNNTFIQTNFQTYDRMIDSPTNNFATLNPNDQGTRTNTMVLSNGNLSVNASNDDFYLSTLAVNRGKWYWEMNSANWAYVNPMIWKTGSDTATWGNTLGLNLYYLKLKTTVNDVTTLGASYGSSFTNNIDILGVALDCDNGTLTFYKNGVSLGVAFNSGILGNTWQPQAYSNQPGLLTFNFGQGGQSGLTYYIEAGGSFKYLPPTGFKALSSKNIGN